jgi:hypothetical protein
MESTVKLRSGVTNANRRTGQHGNHGGGLQQRPAPLVRDPSARQDDIEARIETEIKREGKVARRAEFSWRAWLQHCGS